MKQYFLTDRQSNTLNKQERQREGERERESEVEGSRFMHKSCDVVSAISRNVELAELCLRKAKLAGETERLRERGGYLRVREICKMCSMCSQVALAFQLGMPSVRSSSATNSIVSTQIDSQRSGN